MNTFKSSCRMSSKADPLSWRTAAGKGQNSPYGFQNGCQRVDGCGYDRGSAAKPRLLGV